MAMLSSTKYKIKDEKDLLVVHGKVLTLIMNKCGYKWFFIDYVQKEYFTCLLECAKVVQTQLIWFQSWRSMLLFVNYICVANLIALSQTNQKWIKVTDYWVATKICSFMRITY